MVETEVDVTSRGPPAKGCACVVCARGDGAHGADADDAAAARLHYAHAKPAATFSVMSVDRDAKGLPTVWGVTLIRLMDVFWGHGNVDGKSTTSARRQRRTRSPHW